PLAELLGPANGPVAQKEPIPAGKKTEDSLPPSTAASGSFLPLTGPAGPSFAREDAAPSPRAKEPAPSISATHAGTGPVDISSISGPPWGGAMTSGSSAARDPVGVSVTPSWAAPPRTSPPTDAVSALATSPSAPAPRQEPPLRSPLVPQTGSATPAAQRAMHAVLYKAEAHFQRGVALADRRA